MGGYLLPAVYYYCSVTARKSLNNSSWGKEREEEREREIEKESEMESKILVKSPNPRNKAQTKDDNTKLSLAIISRNYQLVYYYTKLCRAKVSEL